MVTRTQNSLGLSMPSTEQSSGMQLVDAGQAFAGDQGASKLFGQLSRAQWEDYRARFLPYVETLGDYATDSAVPGNAAQQAADSMTNAYQNSEKAQQMQRQGYGIDMTPRQQQANSRRANIAQTASTASAANLARVSAQDRQNAILGGGLGLSNIPDQVLNQ
ncbi:hypothetical protein [Salinicola sp. DM10]|uniref:hypothetical protein n=1 Tax=Salinicola sp. DM10 TaxID=2815721 RepID=UPI001A8C8464|nr:hypothetical protein [Salinicola sp. DM10]MCE3025717.1 hypothetical protein [Salinicola sp. DM10]